MRYFVAAVLALLVILPAAPAALAQHADHDAMIKSALSAAPAEVAEGATVMTMGGDVLREGQNGYTCFPDDPAIPNNSPMCLDATWLEVIDAWVNQRDPDINGTGIAYMLQGDMPVSNIDPFAAGPTDDNMWLPDGVPHIMVVVANHAMLVTIPDDPHNGGPWVMWRGTPYAHIMIPTIPRSE